MMVHAKNYESISTFVKVMQKKLWPLFSGHGGIHERSRECYPQYRQWPDYHNS